MTAVLVATDSGCRIFTEAGEEEIELPGRAISAVTPESGGGCFAVVESKEIWRRSPDGNWSKLTTVDRNLQSIVVSDGILFGGGLDEAVMFRIAGNGQPERLKSFDSVPGRSEWFAVGPPLGVRALTATADGDALLAAVHVGGIPRSQDRGDTWAPTIPITFDVHEVRAHPSSSNLVVAAAAVGVCVSHDSGRNWKVLSEGVGSTTSLAVAVLEDEALFSVQDSPFAKRSQVWRWRIGSEAVEPVGDGLPEWLDGKVDTAHIAASGGRAAIVDGGGSLWLSQDGSRGWERIATGLPYVFGLLIV